MGKTLLKIFVVIIFMSCSPSRHSSSFVATQIKIHSINNSVKLGEPLLFEVENTDTESIFIYYPEKLWIDKAEKNKWRKLKILECLCDTPCQPSTEILELKSGERIKLKWDQKETWCGPRTKGQVRETLSKLAGDGKYRIIIKYRTSKGKEFSIFKIFKIKP